jgi:hypothetical protein
VMTVPAEEFIRLFLQHSLPSGFQRIRYYGFLANCHRAKQLALCRSLLATPYSDLLPRPTDYRDLCARVRLCPKCKIGTMVQTPGAVPLLRSRAHTGGYLMRMHRRNPHLQRRLSGSAPHRSAPITRPTQSPRSATPIPRLILAVPPIPTPCRRPITLLAALPNHTTRHLAPKQNPIKDRDRVVARG